MFLRNYWYVAASAEELGRKLLSRKILGVPVVMYRTENGTPVAMDDLCPHRNLPLSMGELLGDRIRCKYHGLEFQADGKCVHIPCQDIISSLWRTRTYRAVERWRWIWIWMGNPELADESKIPVLHWNDHPNWTYTGGHFEIKCNYQLLIDNLLDLSHVAFVHTSTIGVGAVAEIMPEAKASDGAVHVARLMPNSPPPPLFQQLQNFSGNIDRSQHVEFSPPSTIVISSRARPHGHTDGNGPRIEYQVVNAITPATERICHHFWSVPRNFAPGSEVTAQLHKGSATVFAEDVAVLEAQQETLDLKGKDVNWLNFKLDAGGLAARRIVASLLKSERDTISATAPGRSRSVGKGQNLCPRRCGSRSAAGPGL